MIDPLLWARAVTLFSLHSPFLFLSINQCPPIVGGQTHLTASHSCIYHTSTGSFLPLLTSGANRNIIPHLLFFSFLILLVVLPAAAVYCLQFYTIPRDETSWGWLHRCMPHQPSIHPSLPYLVQLIDFASLLPLRVFSWNYPFIILSHRPLPSPKHLSTLDRISAAKKEINCEKQFLRILSPLTSFYP